MPQRTALLIRCQPEDAAKIRHYAAVERRTVSGYVLNVLDKTLKVEDSLWEKLGRYQHFQDLTRVAARFPHHFGAYKTTFLIRCTREEAERIRVAAERRQLTISDFVMHSLQRFWSAAAGRQAP